MLNDRNYRIAVALLLALIAGLGLWWLAGRSPGTTGFPLPADLTGDGRTMQAFWADDLQDLYGVGGNLQVNFSPRGAILSHFQPLGGPLWLRTTGPGGQIYGHSYDSSLTAYDTARKTFKDLAPLLGENKLVASLVVGPDGRLYGLASERGGHGPDELFAYDPRAGALKNLTEVVSRTWMIAFGRDGRLYGMVTAPRPDYSRPAFPAFAYDTASGAMQEIAAQAPTGEDVGTYPSFPVTGDDGLLYGQLGTWDSPTRSLFALDLAAGTIITEPIPNKTEVEVLVARPGGGVYASIGADLWLFDPRGPALTQLPWPADVPPMVTEAMAVRRDGKLLGISHKLGGPRYPADREVFTYDPVTGEYELLETLRSVWTIETPILTGPDGRIYAYLRGQLLSIEDDSYAYQNQVRSEAIEPVALVLTRTVVGGPNGATRALACTPDGRVYGVLSSAQDYYQVFRPKASPPNNFPPAEANWLFWYDPHVSDVTVNYVRPAVDPGDRGAFFGGTALVALPDGRLAGGTNSGHLFVYDPAAGTTRDFGPAVAGTGQIAALAVAPGGLVYGGTISYDRATLFSFDPNTGAVVNLGASLPATHLVGAVAVAADGRVFAGAGPALVMYDPAARSLTPLGSAGTGDPTPCDIRALAIGRDGIVYGGCGTHLFAYQPGDTAVKVISDVSVTEEERYQGYPDYGAQINAMAADANGRVYGSVERYFGTDSRIFEYDPGTRQATSLGIAVPGAIMSLAACGEGAIYAGSGTNHSMYSGPAYLFAFSPQCAGGLLGTWDRVTWDAETPPGTGLRIDVFDDEGRLLLANVRNGELLAPIDAGAKTGLVLQATLTTTVPTATPVLKHWRVDYTFQCRR